MHGGKQRLRQQGALGLSMGGYRVASGASIRENAIICFSV